MLVSVDTRDAFEWEIRASYVGDEIFEIPCCIAALTMRGVFVVMYICIRTRRVRAKRREDMDDACYTNPFVTLGP
jgi:hypothetical protein